jgi:hypothetical protein
MLQVVTPGVDGGRASAGTLHKPASIRGRFFRHGFNPIDRDFGDASDGVRGKDLLAMFQRAVSRAGLKPTDGRPPEWRAVTMDLEVADCYNARVLVANDLTDATMVLEIPNEGHQRGKGVVPMGDGWNLSLSHDNEWSRLLAIPGSFESAVVSGSFNCEDRDLRAVSISDGGPLMAVPPRVPALPATDGAPAPREPDVTTILPAFAAVLGAGLWLRRRRRLTFGP